MRETGLEPARYYYHQALNLARLPIPPFPQRYELSKRWFRSNDTCEPHLTPWAILRPFPRQSRTPSRFGLTGGLPAVWRQATSAERNGRAKAGTATKAAERASDQATSPTGAQR